MNPIILEDKRSIYRLNARIFIKGPYKPLLDLAKELSSSNKLIHIPTIDKHG